MTNANAERARLLRERAELENQIAALESTITAARRPRLPTEADEIAALQSRADSVAALFGESSPGPRLGERPSEYRFRLLQKFQRHSASFKDMDLARADAQIIAAAEPKIYEEAATAARADAQSSGRLVRSVTTDATGREITTFHGDIGAWMAPFVSGGLVARITRPGF